MRKEFNNLANYIENKKVLCVPIISSIDRQTGEYKLDADGNVNRIITTFWHADTYKTLYLVLPKKHVKGSEVYIEQFVKMKSTEEHTINIIWAESFGIHAGEQRSNYFVIKNLERELYGYICGNIIDVYIMESQGLLQDVITSIVARPNKNVIFWNYTCTTNTKTRSFLNGYKEINESLFLSTDKTIMASPEQVDYFNAVCSLNNTKLMYIPTFMDRDIPIFNYEKDTELNDKLVKEHHNGTKFFYLPYRMTDEGYRMSEVIDYINNYKSKTKVVIYSDPNNSGYMETIKDKFEHNVSFMKVSTSRDIYYTILDCDADIDIPYFEDIAYINHASIQEFVYPSVKCTILLKEYDTKDPYGLSQYPNIKYIK